MPNLSIARFLLYRIFSEKVGDLGCMTETCLREGKMVALNQFQPPDFGQMGRVE